MIQLNVVAGVVLALLFEYVPGLNAWYGKQSAEFKKLLMLVLIVIVAGVTMGLSCVDSPYQYVECSQAGAWELVTAVGLAIGANQGTHSLAKKAK